MAYSNVGTPKFYVDNYLFHKAIGTQHRVLDAVVIDGSPIPTTNPENTPSHLFNLKPNITKDILFGGGNLKFIAIPSNTWAGSTDVIQYDFTGNMKWYYAILNHNCNEQYIGAGAVAGDGANFLTMWNLEPILNGDSGHESVGLNGSSILVNGNGDNPYNTTQKHILLRFQDEEDYPIRIGSVSAGIQYTMPHAPDLKLSMSIEMDGVNTINTSDGGSISNIQYTGNPLWHNGDNTTNPFDIYDELDIKQSGLVRNGRKSWSLKFSYISDIDLFSSNQRATGYTEHPNDSTYNASDLGGVDAQGNPMETPFDLAYNILTDDSFYAQVWNKTLGGALPFIFQPDGNNNDEFYICKFDQNSLRITQEAHKAYSLSVKIMETW